MTNTGGASLPFIYPWEAVIFAGHTKRVTINTILLKNPCVGKHHRLMDVPARRTHVAGVYSCEDCDNDDGCRQFAPFEHYLGSCGETKEEG